MNSTIKYILFLLLIVIPNFFGMTLFASGLPPVDSSKVVVRQPDPGFLESYRAQKEFTYLVNPPLQPNFLKRFIDYLKKVFENWNRYSDIIPWMIKLMLWLLVILFLFVVITKTKIYKLFYSDTAIENPDFSFTESKDQIIDFDEAIRIQIEQHRYREAIRLNYIKLINLLHSKNQIKYSKERTNEDYLNDLSNNDLKTGFYKITSIYNYVWYGEVEIAQDQFVRLEKSFQSFYSAINEQE